MSDLILIGQAPSSPEGQECFLRGVDWWWDLYHVTGRLFGDAFARELFSFPDVPFAPPMPHLTSIEALALSRKLLEKVKSMEVTKCLREIFRDHPTPVEDPAELERCIGLRVMQTREFIRFLAASGGCEARCDTFEERDDGNAWD
jgi:hypothetical protein